MGQMDPKLIPVVAAFDPEYSVRDNRVMLQGTEIEHGSYPVCGAGGTNTFNAMAHARERLSSIC